MRQRVAGKMAFVLESQLVLPEPSEAELRDWFERHRERWRTPELFDFTHVFFSGPEPEARRSSGCPCVPVTAPLQVPVTAP